MKKIFVFFTIFFLFYGTYAFSKIVKYGYIRYRIANIRSGPSKRYKVLSKLSKNQKVLILNYKNYFYKIKTDDNIEGWVYYRAVTKIKTKKLHEYRVNFEFNDFNKVAINKIMEFKDDLNFDFYKKDTSVVFSYNPEFNTGRIFIITDFNQNYYNNKRDASLKYNQIDLYPFLDFANNFNNFLNKIGTKYFALKEFLKNFKITLYLKKSNLNFIILELYRKNKLYFFSPFICLKQQGFRLIKIPTEDRELLKKSYIFSLDVPINYDGTKTIYSVLYDFFNIPY